MYTEITSNKRKSIALVLIFFLFIVALGYLATLYFESGPALILFVVVVATIMSLVSYFQGDKIALGVARAHPIAKEDSPYVYRMVENLSIATGIPLPKIYIIQNPALNAFATGRDPEHASVALTTGIIEGLENEELEGVIAHELSHVKNYDIRFMMVVIVCVGIIALIADMTLRGFFWGGMGKRSGKSSQGQGILILIGIALAIIAPLVAKLIQLAVSRKREFLADASGALATRYPEGLARALEKIAASPTPLQNANRATAHLYIANPFKDGGLGRAMTNLFSTHPPLEERIRRLRTM